jgi:hypothetical protein
MLPRCLSAVTLCSTPPTLATGCGEADWKAREAYGTHAAAMACYGCNTVAVGHGSCRRWTTSTHTAAIDTALGC